MWMNVIEELNCSVQSDLNLSLRNWIVPYNPFEIISRFCQCTAMTNWIIIITRSGVLSKDVFRRILRMFLRSNVIAELDVNQDSYRANFFARSESKWQGVVSQTYAVSSMLLVLQCCSFHRGVFFSLIQHRIFNRIECKLLLILRNFRNHLPIA